MVMAVEVPSLMDDLVEEILLRFPPDDPASLVSAALVCKSWCRLVSGSGFNRRFREFHGRTSPPVLGFFYRLGKPPDSSVPGDHRFMPLTSSFRRLPHAFMPNWAAVDARHGRILFYDDKDLAMPNSVKKLHLVVWNPITGEVSRLPVVSTNRPMNTWSATLLSDDSGLGPFQVAIVARVDAVTYACVYSSEQYEWSTPISIRHPGVPLLRGSNVLIGNALYFRCHDRMWILEYDMSKHELSFIRTPGIYYYSDRMALVTAENGGLGFAIVCGSKLVTWSREVPRDGVRRRWALQRAFVFELDKLLPSFALYNGGITRVVAAVNNFSVIFIHTCKGLFVIDLKAGRVIRKIHEHSDARDIHGIVPYASFCTPVVRSGLLDEEPRAGDST